MRLGYIVHFISLETKLVDAMGDSCQERMGNTIERRTFVNPTQILLSHSQIGPSYRL